MLWRKVEEEEDDLIAPALACHHRLEDVKKLSYQVPSAAADPNSAEISIWMVLADVHSRIWDEASSDGNAVLQSLQSA